VSEAKYNSLSKNKVATDVSVQNRNVPCARLGVLNLWPAKVPSVAHVYFCNTVSLCNEINSSYCLN
jgi:hypothetical protein